MKKNNNSKISFDSIVGWAGMIAIISMSFLEVSLIYIYIVGISMFIVLIVKDLYKRTWNKETTIYVIIALVLIILIVFKAI
ncbi:hypothetical protein KO561_19240 [Radiobacillus kanasensis]|uniref:hypothetical protein n=1 Tax=Radiobacillus kanasensis TaxID=2844358 RepID=UPI001E61E567|nr:hypothetical protein [Radiobacillus kanasensis]UFT99281.1 hypothetical protein KO561_19240 [Radiobacillus kanasensis]